MINKISIDLGDDLGRHGISIHLYDNYHCYEKEVEITKEELLTMFNTLQEGCPELWERIAEEVEELRDYLKEVKG